jgi:hypothetical protein
MMLEENALVKNISLVITGLICYWSYLVQRDVEITIYLAMMFYPSLKIIINFFRSYLKDEK